MSENVIVALLACVPPTLAAVAAWFQSRQNKRDITGLRVIVDGRMTQLLETVKAAAHHEGVVEVMPQLIEAEKAAAHNEGVAEALKEK